MKTAGSTSCWSSGPLAWLAATLICAMASPSFSDPAILDAGSEIDYPPFCIVDADGEADGFAVDLLRATAAAMGREVRFQVGPWAQVKQSLIDAKVDVLPLVARTPDREPVMDFTRPYLTIAGAIVIRQGQEPVRHVSELAGSEVAVLAGDAAEEYADRVGLTPRLVRVGSYEAALRALAAGNYDAVLVYDEVGARIIRRLGLTNLRLLDVPIAGFTQDFCFGVTEGNEPLRAALDEALATVLADGTFERLRQHWMPELSPALEPTPGALGSRIGWLGIVLVALGLPALLWFVGSRRAQRRKSGDSARGG